MERRKRLIRDREEKCEDCCFTRRLQVHHLTYERLFRESDADLMVLCTICHEQVERAKDAKKLPTRGEANDLRFATLAYLRCSTSDAPKATAWKPRPTALKKKKKRKGDKQTLHGIEVRNETQIALLNDETFMHSLKTMSRRQLKLWLGNTAPAGNKARSRHICNGLQLYDRKKRLND